jgi:topoisomerase IA-like protein
MKNIFRASFEVCPMSLYMGDGGAEYVAKMIANPRYGRCPVQREIVDPVHLAEGEIGVMISDTTPDVSKLPHGKKVSSVKKKTSAETLRDVTKKAYDNATKKAEEEKQRQQAAVSMASNSSADNNDADMDALLDSIM